jgi:two-component sensor histidine kinase
MITSTAVRVQRRVAGIGLTVLIVLPVTYILGYMTESGLRLPEICSETGLLVFAILVVPTALCFVVVNKATQSILVCALWCFGLITGVNGDSAAGLTVYGVGLLAAAEFGYFRTRTVLKLTLATGTYVAAVTSGALLSHHVSSGVLLAFHEGVATIGLILIYASVVGARIADTAAKQQLLQEEVGLRTAHLRDEIARRTAAESVSREAARKNELLAAERLELLRELQHRTHNSLQMVHVLLDDYLQCEVPPERQLAFERMVDRVLAISTGHELLNSGPRSAWVSSGDYIERLLSRLRIRKHHAVNHTGRSSASVSADSVTSLGLLIVEFLRVIADTGRTHESQPIELLESTSTESLELVFTYSGASPSRELVEELTGQQGKSLLVSTIMRLDASVKYESRGRKCWRLSVPIGQLSQ